MSINGKIGGGDRASNFQTANPNGGTTVSIAPTSDVLYLSQTSLLATLAINLPSPVTTGRRVRIATRGVITSVSVSGVGITNAPTALASGGNCEFLFTGSAWVRIG